MAMNKTSPETPLAKFVRGRLATMEISQSEFCRQANFDQGLLSKIQNSQITSVTIETVCKLAIGFDVHPGVIFSLLGRPELGELVIKAYGIDENTFASEREKADGIHSGNL